MNELRDSSSSTGVTVDVKANIVSEQPSDGPLMVPRLGMIPTQVTFRWTSANADECSGTDINGAQFSGATNDLKTISASTNPGIYTFFIECRSTTTGESSFDTLKVQVL